MKLSSLYTRADEVVDWRACIAAEGDNHEVSGGHASMAVNREVYHLLAVILAARSELSPRCRCGCPGRAFRRFSRSDAGIRVAAHLERVEPGPFDFCRNPIADGALDDHKERQRQAEHHHQIDRDAD